MVQYKQNFLFVLQLCMLVTQDVTADCVIVASHPMNSRFSKVILYKFINSKPVDEEEY